MTFRHAHLIHKHDTQQQRRIIIPGITLATAALVAVVLLLGTFGTAQAADPREEASSVTACAGMSSGTLDVTTSSVSGKSVSSDSACQVIVVVAPATQGNSDCQVRYTPVVSGSDVSVGITASGTCDGVAVESTIDIDPSESGSLALSSGYSAVRSLVTAWHFGQGAVPGIKMFWHHAKITWSYTLTRVLSGSLSTDYWEGGCGWELRSETERRVKTSTIYFGEHYTTWHGDCWFAPNASAKSTANAIGRPAGGYSCYGHTIFDGGIAGFNYVHDCLKH